jgi:hypothetical protein
MRLHHPKMHLRDASIGPNDPEILPRDRESYLPRRLFANAFGVASTKADRLSAYSLNTSICLSVGESVDRHMHPVVLLTFDYEIPQGY